MSDKPVSSIKPWHERLQGAFYGHDEEIQCRDAEAFELRAAYEALENERDELKQSLDDLQERFKGIKFIESELRKENDSLNVEVLRLKNELIASLKDWHAMNANHEALKAENEEQAVQIAELKESVAKGVTWFSVLSQIAVLLNLPEDKPIPSGVLEGVMHILADLEIQTHRPTNLNSFIQKHVHREGNDAWTYNSLARSAQDFIDSAVEAFESQAQQPVNPKVIELLESAVKEIQRNTCSHEETHRGGAIWEICDICGCKWADDEGGKPEFVEAKIITDIQSFLLQPQAQQPAKPLIYISEDEFDWRSKSGDLNGTRSLTCITPQHFGEKHYGNFTVPLYLQPQAQQETVTVQQAWEWAGGNPETRATRQDLEEALKLLDEICEEADKPSQAQQTTEHIEYRHKNGNVWFHQSVKDELPSWAYDVRPYTSQAQQPSIGDALWENKELMALNADLGLSMDNLVKVANAILQSQAQQEPTFQARVKPWMMECFGAEISADSIERNHRFLEEALELVQACGCTQSEAHQLVDYVFGRPVGEKNQEVGGVMVTLAALCLAQGLDMHEAGETELARIWTKVEQIRAKQAAKPKHSPLPSHQTEQWKAVPLSTTPAPEGG